jgi:hypothetical protein
MEVVVNRWIYISLICLLSPAIASSNVDGPYLCLPEDATGFSFDKSEWRTVSFNVSNERFLVKALEEKDKKKSDTKSQFTHGIYPHGNKYPAMKCRYSDATEAFYCDGIGEAIFSTRTGRFIRTYVAGYWSGDSVDDAPYIMKGKCSLL